MLPNASRPEMAQQERLREVAEILAAAIIRLRLRAALSGPLVPDEKSAPTCLELSSETTLSVHRS